MSGFRRIGPWRCGRARGTNQGLLTLQGADGRRAQLTVVSRKRISPKDIPHLVNRAKDAERLLLVAPFLSPRGRELLIDAGVSYFDATGNLRVVVREPAVFLERHGADRNPDRKPHALRSLKGAAAGRVVRALCEFWPPYGVRTLAETSSTPLGRSYLEPRGLAALGSKIKELDRYAVTGSLAGTSIAPARLAMLYVDDVKQAAETLELIPTEAGANVWLLEPYDAVVFERTQSLPFAPAPEQATITAAAPTQVAADLMTSPGRGPQEAEALIDKMRGNEDAWRHSP